MFPHINPTSTKAWSVLQQNSERLKKTHIKNLFKEDADRFKKLSFSFDDIVFDFSKNIIDDGALKALIALANECNLKEASTAMFDGETINETENRAVLHTALRNFSGAPINLSLDWKPAVEIVNGNRSYPAGFGLSVRFVFK